MHSRMIRFPASKISALVGRHKYVNALEARSDFLYAKHAPLMKTLRRLWNDESSRHDASTSTSTSPPCAPLPDRVEPLPLPVVLPIHSTAEDIRAQSQAVVTSVARQIECAEKEYDDLKASTTAVQQTDLFSAMKEKRLEIARLHQLSDLEAVKKQFTKQVNCDRGTQLEDSALHRLERSLDDTVVHQQRFVQTSIDAPDDGGVVYRYHIVGMIDGILLDHNAVIEVKNRRNYFFTPGYDLDQLAVYCYMLQLDGMLVQQLNGKLDLSPRYTAAELKRRVEMHLLPELANFASDIHIMYRYDQSQFKDKALQLFYKYR